VCERVYNILFEKRARRSLNWIMEAAIGRCDFIGAGQKQSSQGSNSAHACIIVELWHYTLQLRRGLLFDRDANQLSETC